MAPSRTRARPTGREPRATVAKKNAPVTAAESGTPKKRGRGRPPKNGVSKVVKSSSGRPRGRPPKDPSELKPKKVATGTGKGRGRPAATTPKKPASASKATGSAKSQRSGRKGRKSDVTADVEPEANGADTEDKEDVEEPIAQDDGDIDLGAVADVETGRLDGDESPMDSDAHAEQDD